MGIEIDLLKIWRGGIRETRRVKESRTSATKNQLKRSKTTLDDREREGGRILTGEGELRGGVLSYYDWIMRPKSRFSIRARRGREDEGLTGGLTLIVSASALLPPPACSPL